MERECGSLELVLWLAWVVCSCIHGQMPANTHQSWHPHVWVCVNGSPNLSMKWPTPFENTHKGFDILLACGSPSVPRWIFMDLISIDNKHNQTNNGNSFGNLWRDGKRSGEGLVWCVQIFNPFKRIYLYTANFKGLAQGSSSWLVRTEILISFTGKNILVSHKCFL